MCAWCAEWARRVRYLRRNLALQLKGPALRAAVLMMGGGRLSACRCLSAVVSSTSVVSETPAGVLADGGVVSCCRCCCCCCLDGRRTSGIAARVSGWGDAGAEGATDPGGDTTTPPAAAAEPRPAGSGCDAVDVACRRKLSRGL